MIRYVTRTETWKKFTRMNPFALQMEGWRRLSVVLFVLMIIVWLGFAAIVTNGFSGPGFSTPTERLQSSISLAAVFAAAYAIVFMALQMITWVVGGFARHGDAREEVKGPSLSGRLLGVTSSRIIALGMIVIVLLCWMFRYEMYPISQSAAFKLDRWTGAVILIDGPRATPVRQRWR